MKSLGSYARSFWSSTPKSMSKEVEPTKTVFVDLDAENVDHEDFVNVEEQMSDEERPAEYRDGEEEFVVVENLLAQAFATVDLSASVGNEVILIQRLEQAINSLSRSAMDSATAETPPAAESIPTYRERMNQIAYRLQGLSEISSAEKIDQLHVYSNMIISLLCGLQNTDKKQEKISQVLTSLWSREWKIAEEEAKEDIAAIKSFFLDKQQKEKEVNLFDMIRQELGLPPMNEGIQEKFSQTLSKWMHIVQKLSKDGALVEVDFSNMDLRALNFSGLNLRFANFSNTKLEGASFERSDLYQAKFIGTDLHEIPKAKNVRNVDFRSR